jgi:putative DNA primase/helicase
MRPVDMPRDLARMVERATDRNYVLPLMSIAAAPFLRADLTICEQAGYDVASGIYLTPHKTPPIPAEPTKDDAVTALQELLAPFGEMPFATKESKAAFVSHVLADAIRGTLPTAPVYFYTAPIAATGKTLLARSAQLIAAGKTTRAAPVAE